MNTVGIKKIRIGQDLNCGIIFQEKAMSVFGKDWKVKLNTLISKYATNSEELYSAVYAWKTLQVGGYDTRSTAYAFSIFQELADNSKSGTVLFTLIFYELFMEFGELPESSFFTENFIFNANEVFASLEGDEKQIMGWFLSIVNV